MRLALAETFGGGPGYWLNPDTPEEVIATAASMILERTRKDR